MSGTPETPDDAQLPSQVHAVDFMALSALAEKRLSQLQQLGRERSPVGAVASRLADITLSAFTDQVTEGMLGGLVTEISALDLAQRRRLVDDYRYGIGIDTASILVVRATPDYTLSDPFACTAWGCMSQALWATGGNMPVIDALLGRRRPPGAGDHSLILQRPHVYTGRQPSAETIILARILATLAGDDPTGRSWLDQTNPKRVAIGECVFELDLSVSDHAGAPLASIDRTAPRVKAILDMFRVPGTSARTLLWLSSQSATHDLEPVARVLVEGFLKLPRLLLHRLDAARWPDETIMRLTYNGRTAVLASFQAEPSEDWIDDVAHHVGEGIGDVSLSTLHLLRARTPFELEYLERIADRHVLFDQPELSRQPLGTSELDRLGARLLRDSTDETALSDLERLRSEFLELLVYVDDAVQFALRQGEYADDGGHGPLPISRRPIKTTPSILAKLQRQSTRLSQVNDLAGMRVVVRDILEQDWAVRELGAFCVDETRIRAIHDLRADPHHGYRAVHVIFTIGRRTIELQIRTELQHYWAELVETLDRSMGSDIKHGVGAPESTIRMLSIMSDNFARFEGVEATTDPRLTYPVPWPADDEGFAQLKADLSEQARSALMQFRLIESSPKD
jgi:ppGpp synthetase/RelA/SpoT-type nucleotidyltranferase